MEKKSQILDAISSFSGTGKTFAEFLSELFKDKLIEIYLGDSYEDISVDQVSISYPTVFCGKVIGAYRECLILECAYVSKAKQLELGNYVFINERAIRALNEADGNGTIEDMMLRSKDTLRLKKLLNKG